MTRTVILIFHSQLERSTTNLPLIQAAATIPGVEIVDMYKLYPNGLDFSASSAHEAQRLLAADRIVLQFPLQWYSTPSLMKFWQDVVFTRMFYMEYEKEGKLLEGTPLMIAATAGNTADAYTSGGRNLFTMIELLAPLRATANRCGLILHEPFITYRAGKLSYEELSNACNEYATALKKWISVTPGKAEKSIDTLENQTYG